MAVMEIVGWSLLHSVWQGALVALLLWAVLRVVRDTVPGARYAAGVIALIALLVLPVVNYHQTLDVWQGHRSWLVSTADNVIRGQMAEGRADPEAVTAELRRRHASIWEADTGLTGLVARQGLEPARALGWLWLAGALLLAGRLLLELGRARRLAESGTPDARWRAVCRTVGDRLGVRRPVRVRVTGRVHVPALVGWRWPVILVPPTAPTDPGRMGAVLAHELAHVRRNDFLGNLLQSVAEVLLFYNPAAWWISSRIREERECSCDLTALPAVDGGLGRYVRALMDLETARATARGVLALNGGPLLRRVRRLHGRTRDARPIEWRAAAAVVLVAAAAWSVAPEPGHPVPLAARVSATSLVLQDLDGMEVVVQTVRLPGPAPRAPEPCPEQAAPREV